MEKRPNHRPPKERAIEPEKLDKSYFTIYEVADLMQLSHKTIRRMIKSGELPAKRYGNRWRIRVDDLVKFTEPDVVQLSEDGETPE